jgi:hypothetical protein
MMPGGEESTEKYIALITVGFSGKTTYPIL